METRDAPRQLPQIAGYDTNRYLGAGGNGTVWAIQDGDSGEEFAVKIVGCDESLRPIGAWDSNVRHEFLVLEHGIVDTSEGPGILMEYCPAGSAASVVASRGPLRVGEVLTVIAPIAEVLQFLHEKGLTHGDVSPTNILFTAEGKPKLSDFGTAQARGGTPGEYGTSGFVAPEMLVGAEPGQLEPARDIYALAACAWYLLTGRAPAMESNRIPIGAMVPDVNDTLANLLESGLSVDPLRRPSAAQFAQRIFFGGNPTAVEFGSAVDPEALRHMVTTRQAAHGNSRIPRRKRKAAGNETRNRKQGPRRHDGKRPKRQPRLRFLPVRSPRTRSGPVRRAARTGHLEQEFRTGSPAPGHRRMLLAGLLGIAVVAAGTVLAQSLDSPVSATDAGAAKTPVVVTEDSGTQSSVGKPSVFGNERDDILLAVADLSLQRDRMLSKGDATALSAIHAPGSPSMQRDNEILSLMKRNGLRLESLQTSMEGASVVAVGQNESAFVEATSRQGGYRYVDTSGKVVVSARDPELQPMRMELRRDKGKWKIWDVNAASSRGQ
ncbi:serine/threonine protein kinase [Paeniglutamicibacter sp. R2-26]|uniref:serine/threonine protein kinase n=1 Tax=Paeniglutamicibacter sp. R2-26 TaxID=3144417 RepID=UPI003EE5F902